MFLRTVKVKRPDGRVDEYIRLVESEWNEGRPRQRVVCNLGRKDLLAAHAEVLFRILKGEKTAVPKKSGNVGALGAWDWGPVLVVRHLWRELGLEQILDGLTGRGGRERADRALALVTNRLCAPTSEHGMARWLETDFVCNRGGERWLPEWREDAERLASRRPRVRVKERQLKQWYGTLDWLKGHQKEIEQELFLRLRNLFSLKVDLVLYDLTSTYFEGHGPESLAAHGYSRDGKPRDRQILVGLVMIDGWPIAHHVFRGNRRDASTVQVVLEDLRGRFGLNRIVFVGDRGMMTSDNIKLIRQQEQGYVVGLNRRRRPDVLRYIQRASGPWLDCRIGITASEKTPAPKTQVQEVRSDEPGVRVFVVQSDERLAYERAQREKSMQRVSTELQALEKRVAAGKLKGAEKIGAAAARILARHHGYRYYDWEYKEGRFRYFEHPTNFNNEVALEGKYLIQTEEPNLTPIEAVAIYKDLSEVERAFAALKDVLEMRPIFHKTARRVEAHVFVASLAFLLHRALEKKLTTAHMDLSATAVLQLLRTVRVVDIDLGNGETKRSTTQGSARAARILSILGIKELDPTPPKQRSRKAA